MSNLFVNNIYLNIISKINKFNLYLTLLNLQLNDIKIIEKIFGYNWIELFFNQIDILKTFNYINNNYSLKIYFIYKFGMTWYKLNINKRLLKNTNLYYNNFKISLLKYLISDINNEELNLKKFVTNIDLSKFNRFYITVVKDIILGLYLVKYVNINNNTIPMISVIFDLINFSDKLKLKFIDKGYPIVLIDIYNLNKNL